MFFIGVFGIENKDKEIKNLENIICEKCNENVTAKLIKNFDFFHFFFIPILKWNESYYLICNKCNTIYEISNEKGKAIEKNEDVSISYWDLQKSRNQYSINNYAINKCPYCDEKLENNFNYCPHCGKEINIYK
ncbi:zinc ribbon domain-containing protein [Clostridium taeniosporum]|uniref:Zinc-ribbon domain-containing protein n=1 Tax=Clostridium taeniosporum TaxID=394958 RepID=A0A1D7XJT1_9CLOT|nr:zinc ribbon domain-containing protein [Clostridium taeniosporum]AOR23591.1 zinc-ribbon domain-containing protein [Clostridium taeniosporum]